MALAMKAYIQSGPTHQDVPVFQWSTANVTAPHYGQVPKLFSRLNIHNRFLYSLINLILTSSPRLLVFHDLHNYIEWIHIIT